jgi:uncharacterized membrane protein HdeD (DUF308 family)
VIAFVMPGLTALALLTLIAIWAILRGVLEIAAAVRLRHVIEESGCWGSVGAVDRVWGVVAGFPGAGALAVIFWIGAFAMMLGIVQIALAFRLRGIARAVRA